VLDAAIELSASIGKECSGSTLPFVGIDLLSRIPRVRMVAQALTGNWHPIPGTCETLLGKPMPTQSRKQRCLIFLDSAFANASAAAVLNGLREQAAGHEVIVIVAGKRGLCFPSRDQGFRRLDHDADSLRLLRAPFVKRWMALHPCSLYPNVEALPAGLNWADKLAPMGHDDVAAARQLHLPQFEGLNRRLERLWQAVNAKSIPRKLLLNSYSLATTDKPRLARYTGIRRRLRQAVMERFGEQATSQPVHRSELYNISGQHALVMAPPGAGPVTHRFWETLLAGSIPVVAADVPVSGLYKAIPHIELHNLEQVTPQILKDELLRFGRDMPPRTWQLRKLYHIWFFVRAHCLANTPAVISLGVCVGELAHF
jgi:hypothetical protein